MKLAKCGNCDHRFDVRANDRCPECGTHYTPGKAKEVTRYPLGYRQCDWEADGTRCRYPGTIGESTNGEGRVYCSAHFGCSSGSAGATIVQASLDYRHAVSDLMQLNIEAARYARESGLDTVEQMRAFCRESFTGLRRRKPSREWATQILARKAAGEDVPAYSVRLALEVAGGDEAMEIAA